LLSLSKNLAIATMRLQFNLGTQKEDIAALQAFLQAVLVGFEGKTITVTVDDDATPSPHADDIICFKGDAFEAHVAQVLAQRGETFF
jgi:hypothetical protein